MICELGLKESDFQAEKVEWGEGNGDTIETLTTKTSLLSLVYF